MENQGQEEKAKTYFATSGQDQASGGKMNLEILRFLAQKNAKIRSTFFEKNLARESDIIYT